MADPLRDRIAAYLDGRFPDESYGCAEEADAILAIVRSFATSDAAVEAAANAILGALAKTRTIPMKANPLAALTADNKIVVVERARAAITAALGGGHG